MGVLGKGQSGSSRQTAKGRVGVLGKRQMTQEKDRVGVEKTPWKFKAKDQMGVLSKRQSGSSRQRTK